MSLGWEFQSNVLYKYFASKKNIQSDMNYTVFRSKLKQEQGQLAVAV